MLKWHIKNGFKFPGTNKTVPHEEKSQHISLIITPTFASENDYTQTFSRKAFRPLFFRENHTEKNHVLGMRSSNNIFVSAFK